MNIFVYPFGGRSAEAVAMVKKAGYRYAFTVDSGSVVPGQLTDRFQIPRYMLTRHNVAGLLKSFNKGEKSKTVVAARKVSGGYHRPGMRESEGTVMALPVKKPAAVEILGIHKEGHHVSFNWPMPPILSHRREETKYLYQVAWHPVAPEVINANAGNVESSFALSPVTPRGKKTDKGIFGFLKRLKDFYYKKDSEHAAVYSLFHRRFKGRLREIDGFIRKKLVQNDEGAIVLLCFHQFEQGVLLSGRGNR